MKPEDIEASTETETFEYKRHYSLPPNWYHDPAVYEAEKQAIYDKSWHCAGHKSEFANPGDFVRIDYCDETILVVRGSDHIVRGFYNVCQHRGHILVNDRRGNFRGRIVCPYHSWVYGLDGQLRRAPMSEKMEGFPKDKLGIQPVRVEEYGHFIWFTTDPDIAPIAEVHEGLDKAINRLIPDVEDAVFFEGSISLETHNWKTQSDNAMDTYHFSLSGPAHKELVASFDSKNFFRENHGTWLAEWGEPPKKAARAGYPIHPEEARGDQDGFSICFVFPDIWIIGMPVSRTFFLYRNPPVGPEKTILDSTYYGSGEVMDGERTRMVIDWLNGPLFAEDFAYCDAVHRGQKSKGFKGAHFMVNAQEDAFDEHPGMLMHEMIRDKVGPYLQSDT